MTRMHAALGCCLGLALAGTVAAQAPQDPKTTGTQEDAKTRPPTAPPPPVTTAQPPATTPATGTIARTFSGLDKDKDGRVSSTEASADPSFDSGFGAMDANGDGFVTDAEFQAHAQETSKPKPPEN